MRVPYWIALAPVLACTFGSTGAGEGKGAGAATLLATNTDDGDGNDGDNGDNGDGNDNGGNTVTSAGADATTGTTDDPPTDPTTMPPPGDASTSTATTEDTSSTGCDASEICDDVDNDCDGFIDEPAATNLACADCTTAVIDGIAFATCTDEANWDDARQRCVDMGGDLAAFADLAQQQAVVALAGGDRWIGLTDADTEDLWTWADGTVPSYEDWRASEPDNWGTGEDCGQIRGGDGGWGDATCGSARDFVCMVALD